MNQVSVKTCGSRTRRVSGRWGGGLGRLLLLGGMMAMMLDAQNPTPAAAADEKRWTASFEAGVPDGWEARGGGGLAVSPRHFKDGSHALHWNWQTRPGTPAALRVLSPWIERVVAARGDGGIPQPHEPRHIDPDSANGGFRLWVYSERPHTGELVFLVGGDAAPDPAQARYRFSFGLNFHGWRALWVRLEEDARHAGWDGRTAPTTLWVLPPRETPRGSVYLDQVEFTPYVSWMRNADWQAPYLHLLDDNADEDRAINQWGPPLYWDLQAPVVADDSPLSPEALAAFRTLEERYDRWVLGEAVDLSSPPQRLRHEQVQGAIARGVAAYDTLGIERHDDGRITGRPLFASRAAQGPSFGRDTQRPVMLYLALDYRLNGHPASGRKFLDLVDYLHDQGWAAGSGLGTVNHELNGTAGYMHGIFLMRDLLRETGRLEREAATIRWYTCFNRIFEQAPTVDVSADSLRTSSMYYLLAALLLEDSPRKAHALHHYARWLDHALGIQPGFMGTIKPDFVGYHHRGVYGNAYAPEAFHVAAVIAWLLHETPFAMPSAAHANLREALRTYRVLSHTHDIPAALGGRFPDRLGAIEKHLPAYAYLALAGSQVDTEMAGIFMRLWDPASPRQQKQLLRQAATGISYYDTLGSAEVMTALADRSLEPEADPQGHWVLPYAATAIHRRTGWLASVKGWSQYVWDFESAPRGENRFGRYMSHGTLQLYAGGTPVSARGSGYRLDEGWDWRRWPGATTLHLPQERLRTDSTPTDVYPEGRHRSFTDQTFVGGTHLAGRHGLFALHLNDTVHDGQHLQARKTVFFVDDLLVALGSGIGSNDPDHPVQTTLFQTHLADARQPLVVDGQPVTGDFRSGSADADGPHWLVDPQGHGYVIPQGQALRIEQGRQTSRNSQDTRATEGAFATAWLDHGRLPQAGRYAYSVLVAGGDVRTRTYAREPGHRVLQQDERAHVVAFPEHELTGYALFSAGEPIAHGLLHAASAPVVALLEHRGAAVHLSICDPDFRRPRRRNMSLMPKQVLRAASRPATLQLKLRGAWALQEAWCRVGTDGRQAVPVRVLPPEPDGQGSAITRIELEAEDARNYEITLIAAPTP